MNLNQNNIPSIQALSHGSHKAAPFGKTSLVPGIKVNDTLQLLKFHLTPVSEFNARKSFRFRVKRQWSI